MCGGESKFGGERTVKTTADAPPNPIRRKTPSTSEPSTACSSRTIVPTKNLELRCRDQDLHLSVMLTKTSESESALTGEGQFGHGNNRHAEAQPLCENREHSCVLPGPASKVDAERKKEPEVWAPVVTPGGRGIPQAH